MSGRRKGDEWTGREKADVIHWFENGMSMEEIARATDRTVGTIRTHLSKWGATRRDIPIPPRDDGAITAAREGILWEAACIRAERATAPRFRIRPEEWP
jgi:hypothetical protein